MGLHFHILNGVSIHLSYIIEYKACEVTHKSMSVGVDLLVQGPYYYCPKAKGNIQ